MFIEINEKEFEISTKLGTTFKIEKKFKKPYLRILQNIEDMTAENQVDLLACGLEKEEDTKVFKEAICEVGLGDLSDYLEEFIDSLQYPGLTSEEIQEKKLKKIQKQRKMKEIGLLN